METISRLPDGHLHEFPKRRSNERYRKGEHLKYLPVIALAVAISANAAQPSATVQPLGHSQQPPVTVAQCIAKTWADRAQQSVVSQNALSNAQAVDVYVPGQQPPLGAAVVVRPSETGKGSQVGFRSGGTLGGDAPGDINGCL
jgi:hypothetical protein